MAVSDVQELSILDGGVVSGPPRSLYTLFDLAARDYPQNIAIESCYQADYLFSSSSLETSSQSGDTGICWTYAQLHDGANRLAWALDAQGVGAGDTIALFLDNCAESALLFWAAARLKARFAPLDARSLGRPKEVDHYCDVLKPRIIVVKDPKSAEIFQGRISYSSPNLVVILATPDSVTLAGCYRLKDLLWRNDEEQLPTLALSDVEEQRAESDVGLVIFTSGTTGLPKACGHSNKNIWYERNAMVHFRKAGPSSKSLHHLPISHIFGALNLVAFLTVGATIVMVSPRFDAQATLRRLNHQDITNMSAVPSMVQALVDLLPSQGPETVSSRLNISLGGTIVTPEVIKMCLDSSTVGAQYAHSGYGLSEGLPMFSYRIGDETIVSEGLASVGRIAPGGLAKICAPGTFEPVRRGLLGELHVGGPMVINCYLNLESEAFYKDEKGENWFVTGDQARLDGLGSLFILGRYKDIIIRAGENISPGAIEACLGRIPGITSPQVVGTTDELAGEVPTAVLSVDGNYTASPTEMKKIILTELGHSAVPAHIFTLRDLGLSTLPMTTSGKVKKGDLQALVQKHMMESEKSQPLSLPRQPPATKNNACFTVWSRLIGVCEEDLPLDTPLSLLADSLMMLQFTGIMNREFNIQMPMSPNDDTTIRQLASSIPTQYDAVPKSQATETLNVSLRQGPPRFEDMVHTLDLENGLARTMEAAAPFLSSVGLDWDDDVEDVYPVPNPYTFTTRELRPNAWNVRLAFTISQCSEDKLRHALKRSLCRWPLFRALYIRNENHKEVPPLYCIIRSSSQGWLDKCIEPTCIEIDETEELRKVILPAPGSTQPPGPVLFRAAVCFVRDTRAFGLVVQTHHSAFDATSITAWRTELNELITAPDRNPTVPQDLFKLYADTYYLNCKGPLASAAVAFHVARVQGISKLEPTLWPKRRAARWFIGDDDCWRQLPDIAGYTPLQRRPLNQDRTLGVKGIQRTIELPHLDRIKQGHGVGAAMLMKTACTLFNLYVTKQSTIIFGNVQASRAWPFIPSWMAQRLPNPIDICGPTFETLLDVTHIPTTEESIISLLKRAEQDQAQISKWPHVPISSLLDQLGDDKAVYVETRIRQTFNWLHVWRGANTRAQQDDDDVLKVIQSERWFDMGVFWNCGLVDQRTIRLLALYDDCQVAHEEMIAATNLYLAIASWISEPGNWERSIEECLAEQVLEITLL